jgi:C4-dicarboxylate-specific signal transduction histidine kinase
MLDASAAPPEPLTNALDAIEGDGEVRMPPSHRVGRRSGRREIVEVPWPTMAAASHRRTYQVFDPFFTTKEVGKGTGLGLPICQSIVEQHGGTIEIKSEGIGKGALVTVKLPVQR